MKIVKSILFFVLFLIGVGAIYSQNKKPPRYLADYKKICYKPKRSESCLVQKCRIWPFYLLWVVCPVRKREWIQLRDTTPPEEHEKLKQTFNPSDFDAKAIWDLAIKAGMKYITIISKHHDRFCLFKTSQTSYKSWDAVQRDLIEE